MGRDEEYKPKRKRNKVILLIVIGFIGLLAEAVGVGFLFAWWHEVPRSFTDPRLFIGGVLTFIGFIIIIRGVSWVLKQIILMLIAENQ
jgi:uncharacterized BrkB/YihY/UPF0761 family membrane protein